MTNPMLAMLGGALPAINIPCALCLAEPRQVSENPARLTTPTPAPANGVTLVAGTLVCRDHADHAVAGLDHGHVSGAVAELVVIMGAIRDELADLRRAVIAS